MKRAILSLVLLLAVSACRADESVEDNFDAANEKATARFAFVNLNSDGSISFTFNATSLQYTLLAALSALVLAAILLPLLGLIGIGKEEPDYSYAYVDQQGYAAPNYQGAGAGTNYGYAKSRSLGWTAKVMEALSAAYQKYEGAKAKEDD